MANIKNLQMWNTICYDSRISISKSMFGLRTTAIYQPTNSIIDARTVEYSPPDGESLKRILTSPRTNISSAIGNFHPQPVPNGNYMAELCMSRDGAFVVVQILQYQQLSYNPVTEVLIFEGDDAHKVKQLFL